MSIIEKALDKLQQSRPKPASRDVLPPDAETGPKKNAVDRERQLKPKPSRPPGVAGQVRIDFEALRQRGMLAPEIMASRIEDEYRRIKWPLVNNAFAPDGMRVGNGNLIMIASSVPGEGKTFTSLNLALGIATEKDYNVLLVDTDVAKPHVSELLGVADVPGLIDVLKDDHVGLEDVIHRTNVAGLRVLGAGRRDPRAPELLASKKMKRLVDELAARYPDRIVLFDSPPLLATNEAQVLASVVGQIVLVVRADVTPQPAVQEALFLVGNEKPVNLVLNQTRSGLTYHHYYGSSYGYSRHY